jgi:hypothetical protein
MFAVTDLMFDLISIKLGKLGHLFVEDVLVKINIFSYEAARSQWDKMQTSSLNRLYKCAI